jgi:hypothetical protein
MVENVRISQAHWLKIGGQGVIRYISCTFLQMFLFLAQFSEFDQPYLFVCSIYELRQNKYISEKYDSVTRDRKGGTQVFINLVVQRWNTKTSTPHTGP